MSRLSDRNIGLQLSNITYSEEGSYEHQKSFGKNGFNRIFKQKIERKRKLCSYNNPKNPILDIENIQSVSAKIYTILMNMLVNKTEGIIFIYSDFIYSGILPLALALEHIRILQNQVEGEVLQLDQSIQIAFIGKKGI